MHNDEVIWQLLGNKFCSFKVKVQNNFFCRNPYNVNGSCSKQFCPLANGYYATVVEKDRECYLCLKTIERAHTPQKMWQKIKLSNNYAEALKQIDRHMTSVYKDWQINRCKLRLTRLRQTIRTAQRLMRQVPELVDPVKKKTERREKVREEKALQAAQLEFAIEKELLNRLKAGVYGELYNLDQKAFDKALDQAEEEEEEGETEYIEDIESISEEEFDQIRRSQALPEDDIDIEDGVDNKKRRLYRQTEEKKKKLRGIIEYEEEEDKSVELAQN